MMMIAASAPAASAERRLPMLVRPPMSNLRFFCTAYAGGLAFFLTILA